MSDELATFVPSLEMARGARVSATTRVWWRRSGVDLLRREPAREKRLAAIVAIVRTLDAAGKHRVLLRYPYVPSMPFALEEGIARLFERGEREPPECLRVAIERREGGDPYRGLPGAPTTFHGFDYGEALHEVRHRLATMRAEHPADAFEVHTFGWPILWLSYGGLVRRELALLVRPDRVLHAMVCKRSWM